MFKDYNEILNRLAKSKFRSSFHLKEKDLLYIRKNGMNTIRKHALDFVNSRLVPANIDNDGKQTPYRGHPVFVAQHATATCCRGCLEKWYQIPKSKELNNTEINFIVDLIMDWIDKENK